MKNSMKNSTVLFLAGLLFFACSKQDSEEILLHEDNTVNESFNQVFSKFGKSIITAEEKESNHTLKASNEHTSYIDEHYGEEGVDKLNVLIAELEHTETTVDSYPDSAEEMQNIEINDVSDGISAMHSFFAGSDKSQNKLVTSSAKNIDNHIQRKLEETSLRFSESALKDGVYNKEEHKSAMLSTFDEIIEDIENDATMLSDEKSALILSMQLNKENIDFFLIAEDFDSSSSSARGFFKKLLKSVAKVVATVVIVAVTVVTTVVTAGVVGVLDKPRSADQDVSGAVIGVGGLFLMRHWLRKTYRWIDRW